MIIAGAQFLFKYCLIDHFFEGSVFKNINFIILVFTTLVIAAGGYIINDIKDEDIDRINKPKKQYINTYITKESGFVLYYISNLIGITTAFYLCIRIQQPAYIFYFIGIILLLYYYAVYLKSVLIIGNIIVSFLSANSIIILLILIEKEADLLSYEELLTFNTILIWYSVFAFYINFIREIIKDIEDINGDYSNGITTLPIILGKNRTAKLTAILMVIVPVMLSLISYYYLITYQELILYVFLSLIIPSLIFMYWSWNVKRKKDFSKLSTLLKLIMIFGSCSIIPLYFYVLKS